MLPSSVSFNAVQLGKSKTKIVSVSDSMRLIWVGALSFWSIISSKDCSVAKSEGIADSESLSVVNSLIPKGGKISRDPTKNS